MGRGTSLARWVGTAAIAALAAACGAAPATPEPQPAAPASAEPAPAPGVGVGAGGGGGATATDLPLRPLGSGPMSGVLEEVTAVIRDEAAWRALWTRHDPEAPAPAVDFATEMVAVVVLQRPTGGYRVRLDDARVEGGRLVVTYVETAPADDEVTIQVLTQPWAFAALPRREEPATFMAR